MTSGFLHELERAQNGSKEQRRSNCLSTVLSYRAPRNLRNEQAQQSGFCGIVVSGAADAQHRAHLEVASRACPLQQPCDRLLAGQRPMQAYGGRR